MKDLDKSKVCEGCHFKKDGIFCDLSNEDAQDVSKHKMTHTYKKGQTLFIQGNHPFGLYCINKGNIKVTKVGTDGKESIVRIVKPGDVLGHRSLFSDDNYNATATALEETTVCFIDRQYITSLLAEKPSVALHMINKLSIDMGIAEGKVASFHQKNVRERLAELLLLLSNSHGVQDGEKGIRLDIKLTREEMSTMIGAANETTIRFLSELKDAGLIYQEGKTLYIKDSKELEKWANI